MPSLRHFLRCCGDIIIDAIFGTVVVYIIIAIIGKAMTWVT